MTDPPYSELAQYFQQSPNTMAAGCLNTRESTDGVVFPGITPEEDVFCFVGRPSIVAAVGVLFGITPDEVARRLADEKQVTKKQITALEKELREQKLKLDMVRKHFEEILGS